MLLAESLKLSDLLPDRVDGLGEQARAALCADEQIGAMKLAWDYIGDELHGALAAALDCDLLALLAKGWANAKLLAEHADPAKHPRDERALVTLGGHDVMRDVHPVIAVTIGECPCMELDFTFAVTAHFGGLQLAIQDGHIIGGKAGEAWASGKLSCHGVPLHKPADTRKLAIPGTFSFAAPGIPLGRGNRQGTADTATG